MPSRSAAHREAETEDGAPPTLGAKVLQGCAVLFAVPVGLLGLGLLALSAAASSFGDLVVFVLVGVLVLALAAAPLLLVRRRLGSPRQSSPAPWRQRPEWATDAIEVERPRKHLVGLWIEGVFYLIAFAVGWPTAIMLTVLQEPAHPFVWGVWVFPLSATAIMVTMNRAWVRGLLKTRYRFEMDPAPGRLGGHVAGMLRARMVPAYRLDGPVTVRLGCYARHLAYRNTGRDGAQRHREEEELWSVSDEVYVSERGPGTLAWPIAFDVPAHLEASTLRPQNHEVVWRLDVHAERAGLALSFPVPVLEPEPAGPEATPSEPDASAEEAEEETFGSFTSLEAPPPEPPAPAPKEERPPAPEQSAFGSRAWRKRDAWRDARIELPKEKPVYAPFVIALVVLGFGFLGAFVPDGDGEAGGIGWLIVLGTLALLFALFGVRQRAQQRRRVQGTALELDDLPGAIGETISGRLMTRVPMAQAPADGFRVRLGCFHRHLKRDHDGSRQVIHTPLWYEETRMAGRPGEDEAYLEVPFFFEVPPDQPESTPGEDSDRILWRVDVEADLPHNAFRSRVEVPVFVVPGRSHGEPPENPYAAWVHRRTFTATTTPGITMTTTPNEDVRFDFGRGLYRKGAVHATVAFAFVLAITLVFVVPIFVMGLSAFFEAFPINLLLVGLTVLVGRTAARYWLHRTSVTVEDGDVVVRSAGVGRPQEERVPCEQLVMVEVQRRMDYAYDLNLIWAEAGPLREEALQQRAQERAEAADDPTHEGGVANRSTQRDGALQALLERRAAHKDKIKAAERLVDREEAAWIATRIEEAARAQVVVEASA